MLIKPLLFPLLTALALLAGCQPREDEGDESGSLWLHGTLVEDFIAEVEPLADQCLVLMFNHGLGLVNPKADSLAFKSLPVFGLPSEICFSRAETADSTALLCYQEGGVHLLRLRADGSLIREGHIADVDEAADATRRGDLVAVADRHQGDLLVDLADPALPRTLSWITLADNHGDPIYNRVALEGDNLYVMTYYSGLRVFDITDPVAPIPIGEADTYGSAGLVVRDGLVYLMGEMDGLYALRVLDMRDPGAPRWLGGVVTSPFGLYRLFRVGDRLYGAGSAWLGHGPTTRLCEFSLEDPAAPRMTGSLEFLGSETGLGAAGGQVFLAMGYQGLMVFASNRD